MKTFKINGKTYRSKEFDLNMICDLEDMGISMEDAEKKPMSMVRAYFGLCAGLGKEKAGKEIQEHMISGGKFDGIMEAMGDEMNNSDFFRALSEKKNKENQEREATENPEE